MNFSPSPRSQEYQEGTGRQGTSPGLAVPTDRQLALSQAEFGLGKEEIAVSL